MLVRPQPPTPHRTETKKSEADQAVGGGFGDGGFAELEVVLSSIPWSRWTIVNSTV